MSSSETSSVLKHDFRWQAEELIRLAGIKNGDTSVPHDLFSQVVKVLPAAIYVTDAGGRIVFFNEAAAEMWGCRPELGNSEFCGSWKLFWPDGTPLPHDECPMALTLKEKRAIRGMEAIAERPDGTRVPFAPYPTPLFDGAGQLIGALNMLVDLTERKNKESELASIVDSSTDAIISKDMNGIIRSWNSGAERLFGYAPDEIVGKPVTLLIPPDRQDEETEILSRLRAGERIEHYETIRRRKDGSPVDISLTISPVRNADGRIVGASKIARDITVRKEAERTLRRQTARLRTLNEVSRSISSDLDLERIVQSVTGSATQLSGAEFGAFFYNATSENGESYQLFALSGARREAFEKFGLPRNSPLFEPTFRGTGIVRSGDIGADPRYGKNPPHHGMPKGHLPVTSYLAVPVISRSGMVHGGLFFGHRERDVFTEEAESLVAGIAAQAAIAIDNASMLRNAETEIAQRRRAEKDRQLMLEEIKHRDKNTLAMVHAVAVQTFRKAPETERTTFFARLSAMARAHDLLTQEKWAVASLRDIVSRALEPFQDTYRERFAIAGPDVVIAANKALSLTMAFHELATNAAKYGALSNGAGRIGISWEEVAGKDTSSVRIRWQETDGPKVAAPKRKGFGSILVERVLRDELGGATFAYDPEGFCCTAEIVTANS